MQVGKVNGMPNQTQLCAWNHFKNTDLGIDTNLTMAHFCQIQNLESYQMQGNHNAFILINKMQNSTKIFPSNNTTVQHWVKTESGVRLRIRTRGDRNSTEKVLEGNYDVQDCPIQTDLLFRLIGRLCARKNSRVCHNFLLGFLRVWAFQC